MRAIIIIAGLITVCILIIFSVRQPQPSWVKPCLETENQMILMPMFIPNGNGGGTTIMQPQFQTYCVKSGPAVCRVPKNSKTKTCDPTKKPN